MYSWIEVLNWLDNAFRTRDSDWGTLAAVAIGFSAMFLISWVLLGLFSVVAGAMGKGALRWSSTMMSVLVAAAFWGAALAIISSLVGPPGSHQTSILNMLLDSPMMLPAFFVAPFLFNPFALLGLIALLRYIFQPTLSRRGLIASAIVTMVACGALELFYNHHPQLTRS